MKKQLLFIIWLLLPFGMLAQQQVYVDLGFYETARSKSLQDLKIYENAEVHASFVLKHNSNITLYLEGYPVCESGQYTGIKYETVKLINERTHEEITIAPYGDAYLFILEYQQLKAGYYRLDVQYESSCFPYYDFLATLYVSNLDYSTELEDEPDPEEEDDYGGVDQSELGSDYFNGQYTHQYSDNINLSFSNRSYILSREYTASDKSGKLDLVRYYDGLGRPEQDVHVGIAPSGYDLALLSEYDGYGRNYRSRLPVTVSSNGGFSALSTIESRAAVLYPSEAAPYSKTIYDQSPLNRVVEQYGPGAGWHTGGHSVKTNYLTNVVNNDTLNCIHFKASDIDGTTISLTKVGNYGAGELYVVRTEGESGNTFFEFKNGLGQVVLSRQIQRNGISKILHDTYYIYDEYGNLKVVLPPLATDALLSGTSWSSASTTALKDYAYLYKYDKRDRCVAKKLPGTDWFFYVYDKVDRLIFAQDGNQRTNNEWTFYKYDIFGRQIVSGTVLIYKTYLELIIICESQLGVEKYSGTGEWGYTWNGLQGLVDPHSYKQILAVHYYDNYLFKSKPEFTQGLFSYTEPELVYNTRYGNDHSRFKHKGLLTGTITARLDGNATTSTSSYDYSAMYYDDRDRLIQSKSTHHLNGHDEMYISYNFIGQPLRNRHVHVASGKNTLTEDYTHTYDHANRLLSTIHQLTEGTTVRPQIVLAQNTYDELGRLNTSMANSQNNLKSTYTYNIRSWMQNISNTHFRENLTYAYDGNINSQEWIQSGKTRKYTFAYDNLSRLKTATYTGDGSYGTSYTYDKHGNITNLSRYGNTGTSTYGIVDNLAMAYNGNQLIKVTDTGTTPSISTSADFRSGSVAAVQYLYDSNGNLKQDLNKGIGNIAYNSLNLPGSFTISNSLGSVTNSYVYSADGRKLKVTKGTFTTDYCGNVIYENNVLKRILVDGGYYENGTYYFYLTDHLGNNRVVANQSGAVIQSTQYYPFGMAFADGTDPSAQPYKFGGKELESDRGLNLYDFHARWQDAALGGRFLSVDPLAEKCYWISPYVYCANNPMRFVDPTGMDYWSTSDPNEIARFLFSVTAPPSISGSLLETFNFSSWNHATDAEFTGNLTFNDETNTFYSSYGYIGSDGTPIIVGVSIKATNISETFAGFDGPGARWYNKASGRIDNVYPEFSLFFGGLTSVGRSIVRSLFSSTSTMNTFNANQSGFVSSGKQKEKMGQGRRDMSSNHEVQNKQIDDLAKKYGLTKNE